MDNCITLPGSKNIAMRIEFVCSASTSKIVEWRQNAVINRPTFHHTTHSTHIKQKSVEERRKVLHKYPFMLGACKV